jgi:hypothetical protein
MRNLPIDSGPARRYWSLLPLSLAFGTCLAGGQEPPNTPVVPDLPDELVTFVIERDIPGAGKWSAQELRDVSRKSRDALEALGPEIQWVQSYVADDKVYCIYRAPSEQLIALHAAKAGFPANRISQVHSVINLETAE